MAGQPPFAVHISLTVNPESVYWDLAERLLLARKISHRRGKWWQLSKDFKVEESDDARPAK